MAQDQQSKPLSGWAAAVWLVFIAQGIGATVVALMWDQQIGLVGILNEWGAPMPWWTGLVLVVIGVALLALMRWSGLRVW